MTYIADSIEAQGIPRVEFRTEPEIPDTISICFTPTFPHDIYGYSEPTFVFAQPVVIAEEWEYCKANQIDFTDENEVYRICALELVEPASRHSNGLTEAPYWMYGVRGTRGTKELIWFTQLELLSLEQLKAEDEF